MATKNLTEMGFERGKSPEGAELVVLSAFCQNLGSEEHGEGQVGCFNEYPHENKRQGEEGRFYSTCSI